METLDVHDLAVRLLEGPVLELYAARGDRIGVCAQHDRTLVVRSLGNASSTAMITLRGWRFAVTRVVLHGTATFDVASPAALGLFATAAPHITVVLHNHALCRLPSALAPRLVIECDSADARFTRVEWEHACAYNTVTMDDATAGRVTGLAVRNQLELPDERRGRALRLHVVAAPGCRVVNSPVGCRAVGRVWVIEHPTLTVLSPLAQPPLVSLVGAAVSALAAERYDPAGAHVASDADTAAPAIRLAEVLARWYGRVERLATVKGFLRARNTDARTFIRHAHPALLPRLPADAVDAAMSMWARLQVTRADTDPPHEHTVTEEQVDAAGDALCPVCTTRRVVFSVCATCPTARLCESCLDEVVLSAATPTCPLCRGRLRQPI
ncbi:MAG: hypothetical protein ABIQ41_00265, partial [Gemmatimonadales bacterium]